MDLLPYRLKAAGPWEFVKVLLTPGFGDTLRVRVPASRAAARDKPLATSVVIPR